MTPVCNPGCKYSKDAPSNRLGKQLDYYPKKGVISRAHYLNAVNKPGHKKSGCENASDKSKENKEW